MAQTFQKNFKSFSVIGKVREGCKTNDSFAHYSTKLTTNEMGAFRTYFVFFFLETKQLLFAKREILSL